MPRDEKEKIRTCSYNGNDSSTTTPLASEDEQMVFYDVLPHHNYAADSKNSPIKRFTSFSEYLWYFSMFFVNGTLM